MFKMSVATNDYILCDESLPEGCNHCRPQITDICCDLCHPDAFQKFYVQIGEKVSKAVGKSQIKAYTMISTDHKLQDALFDWRDEYAS